MLSYRGNSAGCSKYVLYSILNSCVKVELYALLCEVESTLVLDGSKYERVEKNVCGTV
jgi:hypothetical protein